MSSTDPLAELVQRFDALVAALDTPADPAAQAAIVEAEITRASAVADDRLAALWATFLRAHGPRIARGGAAALIQFAVAESTTSPVTRAADAWLAGGKWDRPFLRRVGKPLDALPFDPSAASGIGPDAPTAVTWVSFAKKGRRAFSLDRRGLVCEWDIDVGGVVDDLDIRATDVRSASIRPDGSRLILHRADGSVVEWNLETRTSMTGLVSTLETIVGIDNDAIFAFVDAGDGEINVWDVRRWSVAGILSYDRADRWLHASAGQFVTCSRDGIACLIDGRKGMTTVEARLPEGFVDASRLQCDGRTLAALGSDGSLQWIDLETGKACPPRRGHEGEVTGLASANGSGFIATVGADAMLRVWDVETGALLASWEGEVPLSSVTVTADNRIAIGDARGDVFMFG